jgi:hypothetical protein
MTRWEYNIVNRAFHEDYNSDSAQVTFLIVGWMNGLGSEGWEIIERNSARLGDQLHINLLLKRGVGSR